jgi:acetyl esterase
MTGMLSEQARAILARRATEGTRPMREAPIIESRAAQWKSLQYMGDPADVAEMRHHFIPTPTAEIPVRIYIPHGDGPFPALVAFHGGCWVIGNIDLSDRPHRALAAATGCVVVAVNYQKAPEHRFPIPLDDCYAGFVWTREHASELGVDPDRVGVAGDSAGGNLAAAVCLKARALGEPMPAAQLLIYPAVDWRLETESARQCAEGYGLTTADMAWSWREYVHDESQLSDPLVSPLYADSLAGLPPAIVVTAEFDILRDEGLEYGRRLAAAGVPTTALHYEGTVHGFVELAGALDVCARMLTDAAGALAGIWGVS